MKKKFLTFVLTLCLIIPAMLGLTACGETDHNESNNSQNSETVEVESRKGEAYTLFTSAYTKMDYVSEYRVKYEYNGRVEYESYQRGGFTYSYNETNGQYSGVPGVEWVVKRELKIQNGVYSLHLYPLINGQYIPTMYYSVNYSGNNSFDEIVGNYKAGMYQGTEGVNDAYSYSFVQTMKEFEYTSMLDYEFNESGDFKIAFNYTDQNDNEYIYEYCVTNAGIIETCNVYEIDFLYNQRGDKYCEITFIPNESDLTMDNVYEALDKIVSDNLDADPNYFENRDLFGYHTESN